MLVQKVILMWKWVKYMKKCAMWGTFTTKKVKDAKTCRKICEEMIQWECCEWTKNSGVVSSTPLREFRWQDAPRSDRPVAEKSRRYFPTDGARLVRKLSGNSGGTKHQSCDSLESVEKKLKRRPENHGDPVCIEHLRLSSVEERWFKQRSDSRKYFRYNFWLS